MSNPAGESMLAEWLRSSNKTIVLTGAGMSTESGVPDFRSSSGWWKNIDPRTVATVEALEENYELFHEFYSMRIRALENCQPHEGHHILADWEKRGLLHRVATQNVDGLHKQAGSTRVDELHGSIHTIKCHRCGQTASKQAFIDKKPCVECGGKLRPNVVLFGELLPEETWQRAMSLIRRADLVIVIGTSLEVYPVNQLPMMTQGKTVYINLDIAQQNHRFDLTIQGKVKESLQELNRLVGE